MCDGLGGMQAELRGLLSFWGKGQFPNWVWVITLIAKNSTRPLMWAKYVYRVILWEILHYMILCHFSLGLQLLQIPPLCCCGEKQKERSPLKYWCWREDVGWGSADRWHFFVSCPPSALAHAHTYIFPLQLRTVTGVNCSTAPCPPTVAVSAHAPFLLHSKGTVFLESLSATQIFLVAHLC